MGLLDLVQEDDGIGTPLDRLGQLAAFLVADISREARRSAGRRCASPCTPTCRAGPWPARRRTGIRPGRGPARSCPTPVGPRKMNEPSGRVASWMPARARRMVSETTRRAWSWPTTRWRRLSSIRIRRSSVALEHLADGDAGPAGDDLGDILLVHFLLQHLPLFLDFGELAPRASPSPWPISISRP